MDSIQLMVDEHVIIKRMLAVIRKASYDIMNGKDINYDDFATMIDFVRKFADEHHHGKEEKFLFNEMIEEIGDTAEKLVKYGMLVEHDLGRLFMMELESSLERVKNGDDFAKIDVIANAVGYTNLLTRHIDKEDLVVYEFARKQLSKETIDKLDKKCEEFEHVAKSNGVQDKYIKMVEEFEKKYI